MLEDAYGPARFPDRHFKRSLRNLTCVGVGVPSIARSRYEYLLETSRRLEAGCTQANANVRLARSCLAEVACPRSVVCRTGGKFACGVGRRIDLDACIADGLEVDLYVAKRVGAVIADEDVHHLLH